MTNTANAITDECGTKQHTGDGKNASEQPAREQATADAHQLPAIGLLSERSLSGRANSPVRSAAIHSMQQTHGNRAVQRFVQRSAHQVGSATTSVQRWSMPGAFMQVPNQMDPSMQQGPRAAQAGDKPDVDNIAAEVYAEVQKLMEIAAERNGEPTI